jgi:lysozyme
MDRRQETGRREKQAERRQPGKASSRMTLEEQLIRDENEVLHAYPDSEGYWTIGVGRLIDQRKGGGISHEEAMYLLANDISSVRSKLMEQLPWIADLDEARQGVLENMCYNLGIHGLLGFKNTLSLIQNGHYAAAAAAMLDSKWATQVGARAQRLSQQMEKGIWI